MTNITDLILKTRSHRRFLENQRIDRQGLIDLVDLVRLCGSSGNQQPLRYMIFHTQASCDKIFPCLTWVDPPAAGERPAAYILVLHDQTVHNKHQCDAGIAMQTMLLAAAANDIGGCILGAIDRLHLEAVCKIPSGQELLYVVALGCSAEKFVLEDSKDQKNVRDRDAAGAFHVSKRPLEEVLILAE